VDHSAPSSRFGVCPAVAGADDQCAGSGCGFHALMGPRIHSGLSRLSSQDASCQVVRHGARLATDSSAKQPPLLDQLPRRPRLPTGVESRRRSRSARREGRGAAGVEHLPGACRVIEPSVSCSRPSPRRTKPAWQSVRQLPRNSESPQ